MNSPAYIGYFDESGKPSDSKIVSVAGYVSTPLKWSRFTKEWNAVLKDFGVSDFHAKDCEGGFGNFKGMDKNKRRELVTQLAPVINRHIYFGIGGAIVTEDYNELTKNKSPHCHPYIKDPYFACFFYCLKKLVTQMKRKTNSFDSVELVFDENNEMQGRAKEYYHKFKQDQQDEGRFASISFASDKDFEPLQAADLLAYESRKEIHNKLYDAGRPVRKCLEVLLGKKRLDGGYLDRDGLKGLVELMKKDGLF